MANDSNGPIPEKGEGNHAADRRYRDETKRFIESGRVEDAAKQAQRALDEDGAALAEAEDEGRSRMAEEDPEVERQA